MKSPFTTTHGAPHFGYLTICGFGITILFLITYIALLPVDAIFANL